MRQTISAKLRKQILERDGNKCHVCQAIENLDIDHCLPVCLGGDNSPLNLRVLCHDCNVERNTDITNYRTKRVSQHVKKARAEVENKLRAEIRIKQDEIATLNRQVRHLEKHHKYLEAKIDAKNEMEIWYQTMIDLWVKMYIESRQVLQGSYK